MKFIVTLLLFLPLLVSGQELTLPKNNQVAVGILFSEFSGLKLDLMYERVINKKHFLSIAGNSNFRGSYGMRVGYKYSILDYKKFKFLIGIDFRMENYKSSASPSTMLKVRNLEFPFEIRYALNEKYSLLGGISTATSLIETDTENYFINNMKVGFLYKF